MSMKPLRINIDSYFEKECGAALARCVSARPPKTLWHYTDGRGVEGIVRTNEFWGTEAYYLNDRSEFATARNQISDVYSRFPSGEREKLMPFLENYHDRQRTCHEGGWTAFVVSFSAAEDLLSQWGYGGGNAYSLGFDATKLEQVDQGWRLMPVIYKSEVHEQLIREYFQIALRAFDEFSSAGKPGEVKTAIQDQLMSHMIQITPILKNSSFEREEEFRLILDARAPFHKRQLGYRQGAFCLIPYAIYRVSPLLPLTSVYFGPTPLPWEKRRALYILLMHFKQFEAAEDIRCSKVPLRAGGV